ncbi:MAG: tRNA dihydrouridine synthase DusB [Coriobacteriia bacterium]
MAAYTPDIHTLLPPGSVVLGPMAGVTEAPFRGICKRMGATLTYTEMISAKGLHYNPDARVSRSMLTFDRAEVPCGVQLFGSDPELMADRAAWVLAEYGADVALIDINMGCPVTKVVSNGEGSALMQTPELAAEIVSRVAGAVPVPVTAKFRAGWDQDSITAVEFARVMESAGAAAVCIHGRTRKQFYQGVADWDIIAAVKQSVAVPVIGSGDVFSAEDVSAMFERTGVDAVMIARGAQGNPWIFQEARALIERGEKLPLPTPIERVDMASEHAQALVAFAGEGAVARMRKHIGWYIVGMPGARHVREQVNHVTSSSDLDALLEEYRGYLLHTGDATEADTAHGKA